MTRRLVPVFILVPLAFASAGPAVSPASGTTCAGETPTLSGSSRRDVITGTSGDDVIAGLGGNDVIRAGPGDDRVCGGAGHDALFGGDGDDRLEGGPGPDFLAGNRGADRLGGGPGPDDCFLGELGSVTQCSPVIAAAGDIACDPGDEEYQDGDGTDSACRQRATSNVIEGENVRAVLALGDLQYEDGALAKYEESYDSSWGRFLRKTHPAPGNHEYASGGGGYFEYFGGAAGDPSRGYYGFDLAGWEIVSLNSNCGAVGGCDADSPQAEWLRDRLDRRPSRCLLGFWHHPRFSSGKYGDDDTTDALWRALDDAGGDLVLSGHNHSYERLAALRPNGKPGPGIRSFVVGTGGRSYYASGDPRAGSRVQIDDAFGVLLLSLHRGEYGWAFVDEDGGVLDRGHADCRG